MSERPEDIQATFCATLVDEWVRAGVLHAVIAPGSRSTPLALALVTDGRLDVQVHIDERSAGFLAIGLALASGQPTVVVTTSGTAAVELHPAVVEADLAGVPLIVCSADRPPELIGVAAPQAIDQTHLYGSSVRWFNAPGVAASAEVGRWRPLAARAYGEAMAGRRGPVHLNLAFREPLTGTAGSLPGGRPDGAPWTARLAATAVADRSGALLDHLVGRRGVILAGNGSGPAATTATLADRLGWPVLAAPQAPIWSATAVDVDPSGELTDGSDREPERDPTVDPRAPGAAPGSLAFGAHPPVIPAADALLRVPEIADELRPEVIVHLATPLASRVVGEWAADSGAEQVVVADGPGWVDPHGVASTLLAADPEAQVRAWLAVLSTDAPKPAGWLERWQDLGARARAAIDRVLAEEPAPTEPGIAQALIDALPADGNLVVSSSMPVRDLEWYVRPRAGVTVHANRGANGIDGVVSTAVGVAAAGRPTGLLIGDVAFLHDSNGLIGAGDRGVDLTVVVVDNDGGGIFSFLPQADRLDEPTFEQLFGTPHGLDLVEVARSLGIEATATHEPDIAIASAVATGGLRVVVVRTDRATNRDLHRRLNEAVAAAVI